jgi:hypothetical protein
MDPMNPDPAADQAPETATVGESVKQAPSKRKAPHSAWKPGQSGNPNGRPRKGHTIADAFRDAMDGELKPGVSVKMAFAETCIEHALKGDAAFARLLANYIDGMPLQAVDLTGSVGVNPLDLVTGPLGLDPDEPDGAPPAKPKRKRRAKPAAGGVDGVAG